MLCDAAQVMGDKLYILGGAWTYLWVLPDTPIGITLAIDLIVPWNRGNQRLDIALDLLTEDGGEVLTPADVPEPVRVEGQVIAGRGPLAREGADLHVPMAVPLGPAVLEPGGYYAQLSINGDPIARAPFQVAHQGQQPQQP